MGSRSFQVRQLGLAWISVLLIIACVRTSYPARSQGFSTLTPVPIYVEAIDWLNVRYGPGLDYPRIGIINRGTRYLVLRRDATSNWLEIAYPQSASRRGWVYREGILASGRLDTVPVISGGPVDYPTLTALPSMVVTSAPPWTVTPMANRANQLADLSNAMYQYLVSKGFRPGTDKVGSVFLMDLRTGERYSIYPQVAFSGMSLIKIPVLVAFYRKIATLPSLEQAQDLALMIVCSENLSANVILKFLGNGDEYRGAAYVTDTMRALGLRDTFLLSPLAVNLPSDTRPTPTPPPLIIPQTTADQSATNPDYYNQTTPADLGWLLAAVYQCADNGTGPLPEAFPDAYMAQKCLGVLRILRADDIPALIRAGVPKNIQVARKHGWINEVHGDAGIVFSPGGDYVLVAILRNKTWLEYTDSFPTIAEVSRMAFNHFNPADALSETYTEPIPYCDLSSIDPLLFTELLSGNLPPLR